MKIMGLRVDGLRKLTAVEMEFADKGLIEIRGKNGHGKTSILDTFEVLLRGNKFIEDDMISHGKNRAEVIGYIGDYEIKRVITKNSNRIEIKNKDGKTLGKPQEFLDSLINDLTFNPRPFLNKSPEMKLRFLMDLFKIDFTDLNEKIGNAESERLLLGRLIKDIGDLVPVHKAEAVNISQLIEEKNLIVVGNDYVKEKYHKDKDRMVEEIRQFNQEQSDNKADMDLQVGAIEQLGEREKSYKEEIKSLEVKIKECHDDQLVQKANLSKMPEPKELMSYEVEIEMPILKDTLEIDCKIHAAEETNKAAAAYGEFLNKKRDKAEKEQRYKKCNAEINGYRKDKKKILFDTEVPIDGLEIREDGIYHNDIFSENWSESEGLRLSAELCLSMKPELKALFVDDGESFDSEGLKALKEWAEEHDLQIFTTIVDSAKGKSEGDVFYIVEGEVI